jgi:hypothetical protein
MEKGGAKKETPPKSENLKLKEKSEVFSDVTHVSKRSYQFQPASMVKVLLPAVSTSTWRPSR